MISRNKLLYGLVDALYTRSEADFKPGTFRVNGDTVDIYVAYGDKCYRVIFFDNEIEMICSIDPHTGQRLEELDRVIVYPANLFVTTRERRRSGRFSSIWAPRSSISSRSANRPRRGG